MDQSEQTKRLFSRYQRLVSERSTWESVWRELAEYILPRKSQVVFKRTPGAKQTGNLFDSTAVHANELLAASMQGALTSPTSRWFRLKMRLDELNRDYDTAAWLEDCTDRMYLALQQSNFNSEVQEGYLDLGCFGVAALLVEELQVPSSGFGGLRFQALAPGEYAVAENALGHVDTLFRLFQMSALAIGEKWQDTGDKVKHYLENQPDRMVELLHAVVPAPGSTLANKIWESCYYVFEDKHLLGKGKFFEFPYMVPRWTKSAGELYGRGPGHTALPDIKTLNKAVELTLRAWAKAIDPPLIMVDDGVLGSINLTPGGTTIERERDSLRQMEFKSRFDVSAIKEDQLRESIKDIFFNSQLQLPSKNYMTATEVDKTMELMQRILGPTLGRLEVEFLGPLIDRIFSMMNRAGALMPPPPLVIEMTKLGQGDIDVEYEGPLAKAQRASGLQSIDRFYMFLGNAMNVVPEMADNVDHDEAIHAVARMTGVPVKLMLPADQVAASRQMRAQKQAEAEQEQKTLNAAEVANKFAPALKALQGQGDPSQTEAMSAVTG